MSQNVVLPALGESVTEAQVTRWLKKVGDAVTAGESLLEVSTDKVDSEVPSPFDGVLEQIVAAEDAEVHVGDVLAVIGDGTSASAPLEPITVQGTYPDGTPAMPAVTLPAALDAKGEVPPVDGGESDDQADTGAPYATPLVKKIAEEKGIDLSTVTGSGMNGRVTKDDVLAATESVTPAATASQTPATSAPATAVSGTTEKMSRMRSIIAERMVEALHTQAQLTTVVEVDVTKLAALRNQAKNAFKAREGANLTFLPFYALATVEALKAFPKMNATISDDGTEVTYHDVQNLAIAVDTPKGLMVPVIKDAGNLNLAGLAKAIGDLGARTKAGTVTAEELQGATFTITNTGSGGALIDTPIVPPGQTAILGTGAITKKPGVITVDGEDVIAIRQYAYLFASYDHRLVDGADAARFLMALKTRIEAADFAAEIGV